MKVLKTVALFVALLLIVAVPSAYSQTATGDIIGRVTDQRILRLAVETAEIVVDESARAFDFSKHAPVPGLDIDPDPRPERDRIGVLGDPVLIDIFPAQPGIEDRFDRNPTGERRRGNPSGH